MDNRRGGDLSYRWASRQARDIHDQKAVRSLEQLGGSGTTARKGKFVERLMVFHAWRGSAL